MFDIFCSAFLTFFFYLCQSCRNSLRFHFLSIHRVFLSFLSASSEVYLVGIWYLYKCFVTHTWALYLIVSVSLYAFSWLTVSHVTGMNIKRKRKEKESAGSIWTKQQAARPKQVCTFQGTVRVMYLLRFVSWHTVAQRIAYVSCIVMQFSYQNVSRYSKAWFYLLLVYAAFHKWISFHEIIGFRISGKRLRSL